ncbi:ABC transporter ATP-binding protein [Tepidicaulis sp. LMO-SS28]|uniref:ABC transporter ATP-binding protein n=1 Tax=Tepidicaulis sp. LMO-SS28 TaxID=3447455 RepID=UPI003EDFFE8B
MAEEFAIDVEGLRTQFGSQVVHDDLSLQVRKGEVIGIVGGSGTGKSVLLRTIVGLNRPAAGRITVLGKELARLDEAERRAVEQRWGILFQDGALFSSLTVAENVQVPYREHLEMPKHLMDELAVLKVRLAGLPVEAAAKYPSELSGGMRKRAGLARALALDPDLLFLDEPTAGLDPIGAAAFDTLVRELQQALGLTVFLVTHDLDTLYATCDRIAVLADKRVILTGTIEDMMASDHPWITEYFKGPRGRSARAAQGKG